MKTRLYFVLFVISSIFPLSARPTGNRTYEVNWPAIYLEGTFSLDIGSGFGDYESSQALGTYQGVTQLPQQIWTQVEFSAEPNFAEITFIWDQGYTGYAVSPSYIGKSGPWTGADEAWQDLLAKGATDGVFITVVPEPTVTSLLGAAIFLFIWLQNGTRSAGRPAAAPAVS